MLNAMVIMEGNFPRRQKVSVKCEVLADWYVRTCIMFRMRVMEIYKYTETVQGIG